MLEEFKRIGRFLFEEGLVDSHGGNMSVREGDKIIITCRDCMLADIKEADLVAVDLVAGGDDKNASRELPTHRAIYQKNDKVAAIIHAHPANAIAISITDNRIVPQDAEGLYVYKSAPIVRVHGGIESNETARMLPSFLNGESAIAVVKAHGTFAAAVSLAEAYRLTSVLENSCRVLVAIRASSSKPAPHRERPEPRKSAIPQGIGVMDRSRYRR